MQGTVLATQPSVFIVSTAEQQASEDEQDRSLLYSFALGSEPHGTNTFKNLSLAVRGVLNSICGEQTRVIRLSQKGGAQLTLAQAHLQACMVGLVLPGHLADDLAGGLVLLLSQTLVMLGGPSHSWLVPDLAVGSTQPLVLKKVFQVMANRVCQGLLEQLEGPGWALLLPCLALESNSVMHLRLPAAQQAQLEVRMEAHQGSLNASTPSAPAHTPSITPASTQGGQGPAFCFYQRRCCLMYRGFMLFSRLPALEAKLVWQLCWVLRCFSAAAQPGSCQVFSQQVYLAAPSQHLAPADVAKGSQRSMLVVAAAGHLVLAVQLEAYDEAMEEELAGGRSGGSGPAAAATRPAGPAPSDCVPEVSVAGQHEPPATWQRRCACRTTSSEVQ
ncbi:hypothetical protein V8C86DRAFT_674049 [Haematococcus lacustris]